MRPAILLKGIIALAFAANVSSCSPTSYELYYQAGDEARAGNYDRAEALWTEAAQGADYQALEARRSLIELYDKSNSSVFRDMRTHRGKKPDAQKEFSWRIKETEHPMYQELSQDDGERPNLLGREEALIGDMFRDGRGTTKDLAQACMWYEKAFRAGRQKVAGQIAEHCKSKTSVQEAQDPLFIEWTRKYRVQCAGGRRAAYPQGFDPRTDRPCEDGETVSFEEFRREQTSPAGIGRTHVGAVAGGDEQRRSIEPTRVRPRDGDGAASRNGVPAGAPVAGQAPVSSEEGSTVCNAKFPHSSREWCECRKRSDPSYTSLGCFCNDNPSVPHCQPLVTCSSPEKRDDPLCPNYSAPRPGANSPSTKPLKCRCWNKPGVPGNAECC